MYLNIKKIMCICIILHVCLHHMYAWGLWRIEEVTGSTSGIGIQTVVSGHEGARIEPGSFRRVTSALCYRGISLAPICEDLT